MNRKDFRLKACPDTVKYCVTTVKFKCDDSDMGKDNIKVDDDLMVSQLSRASLCSGLIMGDRIQKLNGSVEDKARIQAGLCSGLTQTLEILRREYCVPPNAERLKTIKFPLRVGYSYFIINANRPPSFSQSSPLGMVVKAVKQRAFFTSIEPNGLASNFFAFGDAVLDFNGVVIPFGEATYIREHVNTFQKTGKMSVLVERPVTQQALKESRNYLLSIIPTDNDIEMAADAKNIGLEASNMHSLIFRKLKPKSILKQDVLKATQSKGDRTQEDTVVSKRCNVSTVSLEMKIASDVEDEDDLKDVVRKSHAASNIDDD